MREIEFVGGPHDGVRLSSGLGVAFVWTDGKRCFRAPAHGRALYRGMGESLLHGASWYRFVGHTHALCVCGVYRKRRRACGMCGAVEVLA